MIFVVVVFSSQSRQLEVETFIFVRGAHPFASREKPGGGKVKNADLRHAALDSLALRLLLTLPRQVLLFDQQVDAVDTMPPPGA